MHLASMLAINWSPEIRGIIIVIIAVSTLMGSVYLILGTNLGARLGFLVAMSGLVGWMFIMGMIWWVYGIGLKGREASWKPAHPVTIVNDGDLVEAGILPTPELPTTSDGSRISGWTKLRDEDPKRGQAVAAADAILQETGTFKSGEYLAISVYDKGGRRWPQATIKLGPKHKAVFDFLAFRHDPHYVLVEVRGVLPKLDEPGRAPAKAEVDTSRPKQYVMMIRDLGSRRQPAVSLTFGGGILLLVMCWLLHRRDRLVTANRSAGAIERAPAGA